MQSVTIDPTFSSWRDAARRLLGAGVAPGEVLWADGSEGESLFATGQGASPPDSAPLPEPATTVPPAFMDLARNVAAHTDARRWPVLYTVLWRLTRGGERHLLGLPTDRDVNQLGQWRKAVGRDLHKMHAFVRFRLVSEDEVRQREQFVAWFEPDYRIVQLAAPFFQKRFAGMDWSILTPYECAHWDGDSLHYTPGVSRAEAPDGDALDELWRGYYKSIFNPARLKVKAMQAEMPKKYWRNLPEASLISELIAGSGARVERMLETDEREVKPAPKNAYLERLQRMNDEGNESA
jgi:probable DNA metabolism protein